MKKLGLSVIILLTFILSSFRQTAEQLKRAAALLYVIKCMYLSKITFVFLLLLFLVVPVVLKAQNTFSKTESPRYSSDGKRFVFSSVMSQGSTQSGVSSQKMFSRIAVMNFDGTDFRFLTPETKGIIDSEASFSPDSKKIVFRRTNATANTGEPGDIYLVNADGTGLKQLSSDKKKEFNPEFTADGSGVIFVRNFPFAMGQPKNQAELVLVNLTDGKEQILIAKEFRVIQALPIPVGKGGYLVACAEFDQTGKPLPEGNGIAVASPAGELNPRARMNLPTTNGKPEIERFIASFNPEMVIYVSAEIGGLFGENVAFKIMPKEVKKLREYSSFSDANLSPDGKKGVFAYTDIRDPDAGRKIVVREIIGEDFGEKVVVAAKNKRSL